MIDPVILSRIQFAFTISFHILFPAFSIGLATFLAVMEGAWLKTKNPLYFNICQFWTKIFALTFGMGVVSGIVMEFQLGTNWSGFTQSVGGVLGVLFSYEVLTAFFIEAGFLGVMIFGWHKVGPKLHYLSTLLVVVGVTVSAFWILSANSWMQYPTGATFVNKHFVVDNWMSVIFNPTMMARFIHMLIAAYITTLFVISGISAYYLLKKRNLLFAQKCFSFSMMGILILLPLQIHVGDTVGINVHDYQPIKTAAIEGVWDTQKGAPLLLFALPDQKAQRNFYSIGIPKGASLINTHQLNGEIVGLKTVSPQDQPHVATVFFSFRIMVGCGVLMLLMGFYALWLRLRKRLYDTRWFLFLCVWTAPIGFIAILTGWFTAETGRQPWLVYHAIRTVDAASPQVSMAHVLSSLILLILVYGIIFGIFYFRYLIKVIVKGPESSTEVDQIPFSYLSEKNVEHRK